MKNQFKLFFIVTIFVCATACGDVVSDFEGSYDGWTVVEPFNGLFILEEAGGNPDGYVLIYDTMAGGGGLRIQAPETYTGDLSGCPSFSFDAYIYRDGSQAAPNVTSEPRMFLISGDTKYKHTWLWSAEEPLEDWLEQWLTLTVALESSEWTLLEGTKSFASVLANVEAIWLGLDMHWDWTARYEIGVDNVTLVGDVYPVIEYLLIRPNGGEEVVANRTFKIAWQMSVHSNNTSLEYSTDGGNNWDYIDHVSGDTSYYWDVPDEPSEECLIRITDTDNGYTDVSDDFFEIGYGISVYVPNGGEELTSGEIYDIEWGASSHIEEIRIEYSTNSGADWAEIDPNTANDGFYEWYVWDAFSGVLDECLVRISDANDPGFFDVSDDLFTIYGPLLLGSPNGGEILMPGSNHVIEWQGAAEIEDVLIEYSTDNGGSWVPVSPPNVGNAGMYDWTVPATASTQCLVRISDVLDAGICNVSDSTFRILSLKVLSPNGGECFMSGTTPTIEWENFGTVSNVVVEYSLDGGAWTEVSPPNSGNTGSYSWVVPTVNAYYCNVRVSDALDPNDIDISDDTFSIHPCQNVAGDLDGNCYVDISDLGIFSLNWLATGCGIPDWCGGADLDESTAVNLYDFHKFSKDWLFCGNICDANCPVEPWPLCWDWPYQCRGDADNEEEGDPKQGYYRVGSNDLTVLLASHISTYPEPAYNPSSDFDRDGDVDDDDLGILSDNWELPTSALDTCLESGIWPPRF